jgi:hypothetical protein
VLPPRRKKFHKLYYLYKPAQFFWITLIIARKAGLALTSLMFRSNPAFQLSMSLLVTFYSYVAQVAYRPYLCAGEGVKVIAEHKKLVVAGDRLSSQIDVSLRYVNKVVQQKGAVGVWPPALCDFVGSRAAVVCFGGFFCDHLSCVVAAQGRRG